MKKALIGLAIVATIAGLAAAFLVVSRDDEGEAARDPVAEEPEALDTVVAVRTDFVESTDVGGTLGFGPVESLPNLVSGVVTWLPDPGSTVDFGDVLYEVDDHPIWLMEGSVPMYRAYEARMTDGPDVRHLEQLLTDLGYFEGTIDEDFTSLTEEAIEAWQESSGLEPTGRIDLGTIVFRPEPLRVSAVTSVVGSQVGPGSVLVVSSTERVVTVDLDTSLSSILEVGDAVEVEMPDGTISTGVVTSRSSVAVTDGSGPNAASYLPIEIALDGSGSGFDESPVTVMVDEVLEADVVAVPIAALLALAEGGYAVEVVVADEPVLTPVDLGTFLGNEVSVLGDVDAGDPVVVP